MLAPLAEDLRSTAPSEHTRWLTEVDEPAFHALLRARYGDSYSYGALYQPGAAARLWRSGTLLSLGGFDARRRLVSHTGLWIHPGRDAVDSGLSLSHPTHRPAMARDEHLRMWHHLKTKLSAHVGFVHQNTSTLHPLAQRYASRLMAARPSGLILHYTRGETLRGVEGSGLPMHALSMTTVLTPLVPRVRYLPEGPWGEWARALLARLGVGGEVRTVALSRRSHRGGLALRPLEWNDALQLERRVLVIQEEQAWPGPSLRSARARVDLLHVSLGAPRQVAEGMPLLLDAGFFPVGIRLHQHEPDELVFQYVEEPEAACEALRGAHLAGPDTRALFTGWSERCARTS